MAEPQYTKPSSQVDLERRNSDDYEDRSVLNLGDDAGKSENGYVGADPIYQNHANDTEAPLHADEGVEQQLFDENFLAEDADFDSTATPEGQHDAEEADDVEPTPTTPGPSSASTPPTPPSGSGD